MINLWPLLVDQVLPGALIALVVTASAFIGVKLITKILEEILG